MKDTFMFLPAGGTPRQRFDRFWKSHLFYPSHAHRTLRHWVEGDGDVNVHVNLPHMHIVSFVTGFGGLGMLTFMLTCVTCTSYVSSPGWGGGDVNSHVNLRHMHIWRYVTGLGGGDVNVHVNLRHCDVVTMKVRHTMQFLDQIQRPC